MSNRITKKAVYIMIVVLLTFILTIPVSAMDFQVRPELPENQRANGSTFFDLVVTPGQRQDLVIMITNTSETDIVVLVEAFTASTGRNGQINYTSRGDLDESLRYDFEDLVFIPQNHFGIPAESSVEVVISFEAPREEFQGAILGSIRVLKEAGEDDNENPGAMFARVNAVRLVNNEDAENIPVNLALGEINAELVNHRASIVVPIRNTQPRMVLNASATAKIYHGSTNEFIFEYDLERLDFAPNSVFPFSFVDEEGFGIEAGDYRAVINVEHEDVAWLFEQSFVITEQAAQVVNEGALNQQHGFERPAPTDQGLTMWMVIAIAGGGAILLGIIILIVKLNRRRPAFPPIRR